MAEELLVQQAPQYSKEIASRAQDIAERSKTYGEALSTQIGKRTVPLETRDTMGASIRKLTSGEIYLSGKETHQFLVASGTDKKGKRYTIAICAFKKEDPNGVKKALADNRLRELRNDPDFKLDKLSVTNEVYDCQTYVNETLKQAGLATIDPLPTKDLASAKSAKKRLEFSSLSNALKPGKNGNKVSEYYDKLKPGDVLFFLKEVPKEDAELYGKDEMVTLGSRIYAVRHVAVYGGKNDTGEHMISQAHVYGSTIDTEPAVDYAVKNSTGYYDAIAALGPEYFAYKKEKQDKKLKNLVPKKN